MRRDIRRAEGNGKPARSGSHGGERVESWNQAPSERLWEAWTGHLSARPSPVPLANVLGARATSPWKWVVPESYRATPAPRVLKQVARLAGSRKVAAAEAVELLEEWLEHLPNRESDELLGLEAVSWAHALPRLAARVERAHWCRLFDELRRLVESAAGIAMHDAPVIHQLLNVELPLSLAYVLPEWSPGEQQVVAASRSASFAAVELLDGEGLPAACHLPHSRALLACWTRCAAMAHAAGWTCFDADGRAQYEWLVRQTLRLCRADGTLIFSNGSHGDWTPDLIRAALNEAGDRADVESARQLLPGRVVDRRGGRHVKLPEPSVVSEWSELCVMRSKWSRRSPQFACLFDDRTLRSELSVGGRLVWSGATDPQLTVDGTTREIASDWQQLCWFSDDDVDYLELEAEFELGWTIQRQMLLARADHFLFCADAVIGPSVARINYQTTLPLADDVRFDPEIETWEGCLANQRPLCTVLPLALPEWRTAPARGTLTPEGIGLKWTLADHTQRLYAPLFFDLSPRRLKDRRTWRELTVAERLEIVARDQAVGYRVQLGRSQWLIYRSLTPRRNRSFFGQNTSDEFVVTRFDLDGSVDELIEIQ